MHRLIGDGRWRRLELARQPQLTVDLVVGKLLRHVAGNVRAVHIVGAHPVDWRLDGLLLLLMPLAEAAPLAALIARDPRAHELAAVALRLAVLHEGAPALVALFGDASPQRRKRRASDGAPAVAGAFVQFQKGQPPKEPSKARCLPIVESVCVGHELRTSKRTSPLVAFARRRTEHEPHDGTRSCLRVCLCRRTEPGTACVLNVDLDRSGQRDQRTRVTAPANAAYA
jgi:hypothetical protein